MKKELSIFLIVLFAFVDSTNAQNELDSFKIKFEKFKKYEISNSLIGYKWINLKVGFNDPCDTVFFQGNYYDLTGFDLVFDRFIIDRSKQDTVVLQLDYGDNVFLNKIYKSHEILANQIEKYSDNGIYYFSTYAPQKEIKYIKTDTIDLHTNKIIQYNGEDIKYSDLSKRLKIGKPELLILRADSKVSIQDLRNVLELTNNLKIKTVLR